MDRGLGVKKVFSEKNKVWNRNWLFVPIVIFLFSLINCFAQHFSYEYAFLFMLVLMFGIFIPGLAIVQFFLEPSVHSIVKVSVAGVLGLGVLIAEYFFISLLSIKDYSLFIFLIVAVLSAASLWRHRRFFVIRDEEKWDWVMVVFLMALLFSYLFIMVSLNNVWPWDGNDRVYYVDWLFWIGNNISLKKSFPAMDYRVVGNALRYHFFSSVVVAQISLISQIDVCILSFYYSYLISGTLLVVAAYAISSYLIKNRVLVVITTILILFLYGPHYFYYGNVYICPMGMDYAMASAMVLIRLLFAFRTKPNQRILVLVGVLFFLITGFKGPVSVGCLAAAGMVCFTFLVQRDYKHSILPGIIWLFSFFLSYCCFIYNSHSSPRLAVATWEDILATSLIGRSVDWIEGFFPSMNDYLVRILSHVDYSMRFNYLTFWGMIVAMLFLLYCKRIKDYRRVAPLYLSILAMTIIGILLSNHTTQRGGSQIYFLESVLPFGVVVGISAAERIFCAYKESLYFQSKMGKTVLGLLAGLLAVGIFSGLNGFWGKFSEYAVYGNNLYHGVITEDMDQRYYMQYETFEAYEWIKENVDENVYIAVDKKRSKNVIHELLAGVFSEHYIWNDGKYSRDLDEVESRDAMVQLLVNGDEDRVIPFFKKNNIQYLITTKDGGNIDYRRSKMSCVYENKNVKILKIFE